MMYKLITIFLAFCTVIFYCSKNPFSESNTSIPNRTEIAGKVKLNDDSSPEKIFVWLEGFDISTNTNSDGNFKLELSDLAINQNGLNGLYKIYYYVANYKIKTSSITIVNGKIERNKGDVDKHGNIKNTIILEKLVDIKTTIEPSVIQVTDSMRLELTVSLKLHVNELQIETSKSTAGYLTAMIFLNESSDYNEAVLYGTDNFLAQETIHFNVNYKMGIKARWLTPDPKFTLPVGNYFVVPYLRIIQENLPEALIQKIGENANKYHQDYLKIPIRQDMGHLIVTPASATAEIRT